MGLTELVDKHALVVFIILAYGLTWLIVLPLVLEGLGLILLANWMRVLHYFAPAGPALAAIIVTGIKRGRDGVRSIWERMTRWRVGPVWVFVAVALIWVFYLAAGAIIMLTGQPWPDIGLFGSVRYLPYMTFMGAWLLWVFSYGLGEETGWRGFVLPHLQGRHSALVSAILVSLIWAPWHAPFFFYDTNLQAMGPAGTVMWIVGMMSGSVWQTWLYNSTRGSILMVALWHGTYNLFTAAEGASIGPVAGFITIFLMIFVVSIVLIYKPTDLSREERQTAGK
jgi:membrane protease YdiL (CAAX protease family)